MTYDKIDVKNWLFKYFAINRISGNEINFPCPYCEHEAFYFNVAKSLGFCHHDKCHKSVTIEDLIDIIGSEPEPFSFAGSLSLPIQDTGTPCHIPATAKLATNDAWAIEALAHRNVSLKDIEKFNIHSTATMLFVPVYSNGTLVQYVGRAIDRNRIPVEGFKKTGQRYQYHKGNKISDYLFGWDECKLWTDLVLVENTFNAIWLRDKLNCSTNFGSFLSDNQIKKLINSNVKSVALLWDGGASPRAEIAVRALKKAGIRSVFCQIEKQPDDYPFPFLEEIIMKAREAMKDRPEINFI